MDVLTVGETMVVFSTRNNKSIVHSNSVDVSIAGAESNVATALARLDYRVRWISRVGEDFLGDKILNTLRGDGVDVNSVVKDPHYPTGVMVKQKKSLLDSEVLYYRSNSAATRLSEDNIDESWVKEAKIIHLTGITPALSHSCQAMMEKIIRLAKKHDKLISFDPNLRLKLWDMETAREVLLPMVKQCDIFLPNVHELKQLFAVEDKEEAMNHLRELKVPISVIKDGGNGAWLQQRDEKESEFIPAYKVEQVVDEIGAGDAFASGFLHGMLEQKSLIECVKLGHALAAFVISVAGDTEGLPTRNELARFRQTGETTIR